MRFTTNLLRLLAATAATAVSIPRHRGDQAVLKAAEVDISSRPVSTIEPTAEPQVQAHMGSSTTTTTTTPPLTLAFTSGASLTTSTITRTRITSTTATPTQTPTAATVTQSYWDRLFGLSRGHDPKPVDCFCAGGSVCCHDAGADMQLSCDYGMCGI